MTEQWINALLTEMPLAFLRCIPIMHKQRVLRTHEILCKMIDRQCSAWAEMGSSYWLSLLIMLCINKTVSLAEHFRKHTDRSYDMTSDRIFCLAYVRAYGYSDSIGKYNCREAKNGKDRKRVRGRENQHVSFGRFLSFCVNKSRIKCS